MKRIVLHIDSLVLRGFPSADRLAIAAGLRDALGGALADAGSVERLIQTATAERFAPVTTNIGYGTKPDAVGRAVGQAIAGGRRR